MPPVQLQRLFENDPDLSEFADWEWKRLIAEASAELLLPALRHRLTELDCLHCIPPDIDSVLAYAETFNRERNQCLIDEALHITRLLNTVGIKPVALKGLAYLLGGVYSDPGHRYLLDIDLLIPQNSISAATALLHRNGYLDDKSDIIGPLRHHAPAMRRSARAPVELHHRVALGVCDRILPASEVFADAAAFEREGAHLLLPSSTHLISHLILHSQLHNAYRYRVFPPLRALYDLLLLTRKQDIDWPFLVKRYREAGEFLTLTLHLQEAHRVVSLELPFDLPRGPVARLRWARRRLIGTLPWLRFFDPIHILMATLRNRIRMVARVIEQPEHRLLFVRACLDKKSYRNLFGL